MKIRDFCRHCWDSIKAKRRGEKRIEPMGARGRIFAKMKLRVYRVREDKWYDVEEK